MPRKQKQATVNELLRNWRNEAEYDLDEAAVELRRRLDRKLSRETVRRYETTYQVQDMEPIVLAGLVYLYGHHPDELPEPAASHVNKARDLLVSGFGWLLGSPVAA